MSFSGKVLIEEQLQDRDAVAAWLDDRPRKRGAGGSDVIALQVRKVGQAFAVRSSGAGFGGMRRRVFKDDVDRMRRPPGCKG